MINFMRIVGWLFQSPFKRMLVFLFKLFIFKRISVFLPHRGPKGTIYVKIYFTYLVVRRNPPSGDQSVEVCSALSRKGYR